MKRALVPVLIATVLAGLLLLQLLGQGAHECQVCVTWKGARRCATSRATTVKDARRFAQDSACSLIAHGVTDAMACPRIEADETTCDGKSVSTRD